MTRSNLPEGDDGHVVADMNVEGMPWYKPDDDRPAYPEGYKPDMLDKQQARMATWGAFKAAMLICAVFSLGIILFTLFCTKVWFRN